MIELDDCGRELHLQADTPWDSMDVTATERNNGAIWLYTT